MENIEYKQHGRKVGWYLWS